MKRLIFATFFFLSAFSTLTVLAASADKGSNRKPEEDFLSQRSFRGAPIRPDAYDKAKAQWDRVPKSFGRKQGSSAPKAVANKSTVTSLTGTTWVPIGPSPLQQGTSQVNGRVTSIAVNPNNPNVIYMGAAGGGVWRTVNGGTNWAPLTDQQSSLGTGQASAIAVDPNNTNTIYVGTSNSFLFFSQSFSPQISKGILKSTDGGGSWIVLGSGFPAGNTGNASALFSGNSISEIIVDPANSNTLYLAANSGLFVSTNAGQTWTSTRGGNAQSLALDTSVTPRRLYAGINGLGVVQSVDGGLNWTTRLNSGTAVVGTAIGAAAGSSVQKVVVALAPPTSPTPNAAGVQVLYVSIDGFGNASSAPLGIFESTDQGANWTQRTAGGGLVCQCGFSMEMAVDPASPGDGVNDILYWGGTNQWRSTDSGNNFANITNGQHVDQHSWRLVRPPSGSTIILSGNDGGLWRSTDNGATWTGTGAAPPTINAGGLQTTMIYNVDVKNDATGSVSLISLQDNGTGTPSPTVPLPQQWTDRTGGDGFHNAFAAAGSAATAFAVTGCNDTLQRSTNDGTSWASISAGIPATEFGCNILQVATDPGNAVNLYFAGVNSLFRSTNATAGAPTWTNINAFAQATSVTVAPANSNNVAVAVGALVSVSTNATGATPTFTNIAGLPSRAITSVRFDPNDPTILYATVSGFNSQSPATPGHVFRSTVTGTSWTNISPPVDIPVNSIALDGGAAPTAIYIGTDLGVMRSVDGGTNWTVIDDVHLPNVPVTSLALKEQSGVLRISTYGRGAFELGPANGPVIGVNAQNGLQFGTVCVGSQGTLTLQIFNLGTVDLIINGVQNLFNSPGFTILSPPSTPIVIRPNSEVDFAVAYTPSTQTTQQATIRISSTDPNAPYFDLTATGTGGSAAISTIIADTGSFGNVCVGSFKDLPLSISDSGSCALRVTNISSSNSQFKTASVLSYPLIVGSGDATQVPIRFAPTTFTTASPLNATITVTSSDPANPNALVAVSGTSLPPIVKVSGSTVFGDVCGGAVAEKTLQIANTGPCALQVISASINCPDFTIANNPFPTTIGGNSSLNLTIRFTPTSAGPKSCILTLTTNDPANPTLNFPLTANTPLNQIDVPPTLSFLPEVIQSVGTCKEPKPLTINNKGTCPIVVTNMAISGANGGDFSYSGAPSFPLSLQPGQTIGDGNLKAVFAPTALDRDRLGTATVTYEQDPITRLTTTASTAMCGEGVYTGVRILVTAGGIPLSNVDSIMLQRVTANRNQPILNTVDTSQNLSLVTVTPAAPCASFKYHKEYGTIDNASLLVPGSYIVTVQATIDRKRVKQTVSFSDDTCGFNPTVVVQF